MSAEVFTKEQFLKQIEAIEKVTKDCWRRRKRRSAARKEDVREALARRGGGTATARPEDVRGKTHRVGCCHNSPARARALFRRLGFGPPGGGPGFGKRRRSVDDENVQDIVKAPADFDVTLFAAPPKVGYPVAVAAAPSGEVFVAVDEQGRLGRTPGGGKVLRCVDRDGDGKVDQVTVFAKMDHPRGLIYQDGNSGSCIRPT